MGADICGSEFLCVTIVQLKSQAPALDSRVFLSAHRVKTVVFARAARSMSLQWELRVSGQLSTANISSVRVESKSSGLLDSFPAAHKSAREIKSSDLEVPRCCEQGLAKE